MKEKEDRGYHPEELFELLEKTDNELLEISNRAAEYREELVELAKDILIKREAFNSFPSEQLQSCMQLDMYNEVDKKVMAQIIDSRTHSTMTQGERKYAQTAVEAPDSIYRLLEKQTKDIQTIKRCAVFFVLLTLLGGVAFFVGWSNIVNGVIK